MNFVGQRREALDGFSTVVVLTERDIDAYTEGTEYYPLEEAQKADVNNCFVTRTILASQ